MKKTLALAYKKKPLISVIMPVYNAASFLPESITSILNQTYTQFELIIVDDASVDASLQIVKEYSRKDSRIKLLSNYTHQGVSKTVNKAIHSARGLFLARMDADDISCPRRLEKQIAYLKDNSDTVAVGSQCILIDEHSEIIGKKVFPLSFQEIYQYIFRFIPLQQPSLMIARQRLPDNFEYYQDGKNTAEEVELIFKLFQCGKVENMPDFLLYYRIHSRNTSFQNIRKTFYLTLQARIKAVFKYRYVPRLQDIVTTIAQCMIVTVLPQYITLWLYKKMRPHLHFSPKPIASTPLLINIYKT